MPVYRAQRTADEDIALEHLEHYLGHHDRFFVLPESLPLDAPGYGLRRFDDAFFESTKTYSRLLLSRRFYEAFAAYDYILIYQLDCLVFSDDLSSWCALGYDYIGAPWLREATRPQAGFSRVGNGGLSLRRVESFLRVIDSPRYLEKPVPFWSEWLTTSLPDVQEQAGLPQRVLKKARVLRAARDGAREYLRRYTLNEDHFWSDRARLFDPGFKVAPVEVALPFAFERAPRYCFEQNGHRLPFGCHAWARWDRVFWEPYIRTLTPDAL